MTNLLENLPVGVLLNERIAKDVLHHEIRSGLVKETFKDDNGDEQIHWVNLPNYSSSETHAFSMAKVVVEKTDAVLSVSVAQNDIGAVFTLPGQDAVLGISGKTVAHAVSLAALDLLKRL